MECIHLPQKSLVAGFCKHVNELRATINSGEFVEFTHQKMHFY